MLRSTTQEAPERLARRLDLTGVPQLAAVELGHLRHIHNLAAQPPGDWSRMGGMDPGQELIDAYRYQLAHLAYALALAHFHHLPAARGVCRQTFKNLIDKMMRREVWGFWRESSKGSAFFDPSLTTVREQGKVNPVGEENIMYSGHLAAMVGLYSVLFDDDRYFEEGALTFEWRSILTGDGPFSYPYDLHSLNQTIYWQMVENGYLGVACEPNCVFFVCNQFPILGFRCEDLRKGTDVAGEVTAEYLKAWQAKGLLNEQGYYPEFWQVVQNNIIPSAGPAGSNWANAIMNAWNGDFVRSVYGRQVDGLFTADADGTPRWLGRSPDRVAALPPNGAGTVLGFTAMILSEMGDERLDELLDYADTHLRPTWERGGLFYPRHDDHADADGRLAAMDTLTGNALLGYARLNVRDGLKALYQRPWSPEQFAEPKVEAVTGCELATAAYDTVLRRLAVRLAPTHGSCRRDAVIGFDLNGHDGPWRLYRDGRLVASSNEPAAGAVGLNGQQIELRTEVERDVDVVLLTD